MLMTLRGFVLPVALALAAIAPLAAQAGEPYLVPLPGEEIEVSTSSATAYARADTKVRVTIDFATLLVLENPATTVIVGNPSIVEANLSDDRTVILTGKTAGSTNFMALDASGSRIADLVIQVVAAGGHVITVHQGVNRETYTCVRRCEPVLSVGDNNDFFGTTATQTDTRTGFSTGGAAGQ